MNSSYVSVDTSSIHTVSGELLLTAAYTVILGLLLGYSAYLLIKTKYTNRQIEKFSKNTQTGYEKTNRKTDH
jgi:NhaP-type Na+/H+ or K+/H+ antiporter